MLLVVAAAILWPNKSICYFNFYSSITVSPFSTVLIISLNNNSYAFFLHVYYVFFIVGTTAFLATSSGTYVDTFFSVSLTISTTGLETSGILSITFYTSYATFLS